MTRLTYTPASISAFQQSMVRERSSISTATTGLAVGPLGAGVLAGYWGFELPFYVVGGLSLAVAGGVALGAREPPRPAPAV